MSANIPWVWKSFDLQILLSQCLDLCSPVELSVDPLDSFPSMPSPQVLPVTSVHALMDCDQKYLMRTAPFLVGKHLYSVGSRPFDLQKTQLCSSKLWFANKTWGAAKLVRFYFVLYSILDIKALPFLWVCTDVTWHLGQQIKHAKVCLNLFEVL